jgi:hypothetical protein
MSVHAREQVDHEKYQRLIGRLIYLCHTHPDISFVMSVVKHYMHNPKKNHLKSAPKKDLIFRNNEHLNIEGYYDSDLASCQDDRRSPSSYYMFIGGNLIS